VVREATSELTGVTTTPLAAVQLRADGGLALTVLSSRGIFRAFAGAPSGDRLSREIELLCWYPKAQRDSQKRMSANIRIARKYGKERKFSANVRDCLAKACVVERRTTGSRTGLVLTAEGILRKTNDA